MNILKDINTVLCLLKSNSNTIELTVRTSCYWGLRLTLCYKWKNLRCPRNILPEMIVLK